MIRLPSRILLKKKSNIWHQKLIGKLLSPFNKKYMTGYWTTIGRTIYVPTKYDADEDWAQQSWIDRHEPVLSHEMIHVEQYDRRGSLLHYMMYLGPSPFLLPVTLLCLIVGWSLAALIAGGLTIALLPLSVGLAYGRWRTEREAYQVSRMYGSYHGRIAHNLWHDYLFTWPKTWAMTWFEKHPAPKKAD